MTTLEQQNPKILQQSAFFSNEQISLLNPLRIPHHIAFIPDGNRRWAKRQQEQAISGHRAGADILMDIVKASKELGVKCVTIYVFSTENWSRDPEEIKAFLWLLDSYLQDQQQSMIENGIRLKTIGDLTRLPEGLNKTIQTTVDLTADCNTIDMVLAINYGGRDEIRRAVQSLLDDYDQNKLTREKITEKTISSYLDTADHSDPELLIRTSGEMRISNFLIWQTSYTEVYMAEALWPDFTPDDLLKAIINFQGRNRRWGGA